MIRHPVASWTVLAILGAIMLSASAAQAQKVYRIDTNSYSPPALHEYDIPSDTWAIRATLPAPNFTQLATDTVNVYALPADGNVYRYDPVVNAWVFVQAGPAAAIGAGPIAMFETHAGEFYWGGDGTSTLYYTVGGVWSSVSTPRTISSGSGIDRTSGTLYIRQWFELGFIAYDTATNSFPTICDVPTSVGENSRVGVFYNGLFYSRDWSAPLSSIDPVGCAVVDTGVSLATTHASTDVSPQGVIYLNGYGPTETTFEAFDIGSSSVTPLASAPLYGGNAHASLVVVAPCGNGDLDPGEQCDDGNTTAEDCCSPTCQFEVGSCDDGNACTTGEQCNGSGSCTGGATVTCNDGDLCTQDRCDTGTGCQNVRAPAPDCRLAGKSILLVKNGSTDAKDKLIWKWLKGPATTPGELGVPGVSTGYALCVYAGPTKAGLVLPPGSAWQPLGAKGYKRNDPAGLPDGVQKAMLKSGGAGKAKALVKGKGSSLPDFLTGMLSLPVTVQLVNSDNAVCFEAQYGAADVLENTAQQFKAKTP